MGLLSRVQPQGKKLFSFRKAFFHDPRSLAGILKSESDRSLSFLGGDISDIIAEMQCSSGATLNHTASAAVNPRSGPLAIENKFFGAWKVFFPSLPADRPLAIENKTFWGLKSVFPSLPADRPLAIENKTFWGLKSCFSFLACWPASGDRK